MVQTGGNSNLSLWSVSDDYLKHSLMEDNVPLIPCMKQHGTMAADESLRCQVSSSSSCGICPDVPEYPGFSTKMLIYNTAKYFVHVQLPPTVSLSQIHLLHLISLWPSIAT